jgi:alpha-1,2-glucosyltransferase
MRRASIATNVKNREHLLFGAAIALILGVVFIYFRHRGILGDELVHIQQIEKFYRGDYSLLPQLTTLPGYHYFMLGMAQLVDNVSLQTIRAINCLIGIGCITVYAMLLKQIYRKIPTDRLIQFSFFPIIFPYYFLVYTDVLSLFVVLLALLLALRERHFWAALMCALSITVRQVNIVWLLMIPLLAHGMVHGFALSRKNVPDWLRSGWMYGLGVIAFAAFVYVNQGIAVGDKDQHPAFTFHFGNIYFFLATYFLFFLPSIVANIKPLTRALLKQRYAILLFAALFTLYMVGFQNDHPYNHIMEHYFLRNYLLKLVFSTTLVKVIAFVPMAIAAFHMIATRTRRYEQLLIIAFTALALIPSWLVEQRYYIIPFALLLLFRKPERQRMEALYNVYYVGLSVTFIYGMQMDYFFL